MASYMQGFSFTQGVIMQKGRAIGGPRHNFILTAGATWDGRIKYPEVWSNARADSCFYPGHYRWNSYRQKWVWKDYPPEGQHL